MKTPIVVGAAAATLVCAAAVSQQSNQANQTTRGIQDVAPAIEAVVPHPLAIAAPDLLVQDAIVVQFEPIASMVCEISGRSAEGLTGMAEFDAAARELGVKSIAKQFVGAAPFAARAPNAPDLSGYFVVTFDPAVATVDMALAAYRQLKLVVSVEPIGIHAVLGVPNDGNYASQWHLNQANDRDIDAPEGWNISTGSPSVVVAVLDTGVRYYHKDLGGVNASSTNTTATQGNIWINTAEKNGVAGIDDDGNGFVDDWVGYDFVSSAIATCWSGEDCTSADADPRDFNGHGTHCAGLVGAMNNNGYAVASAGGGWGNGANSAVGSGVRVMSLRIGHSASYLGQEVGYVRMDYAASAFYYAAQKGAKIASCSWGSSNSGGLAAAVDNFLASGGLIFKAAGNSNNQTADYLCARTDVYSVVALDQNDVRASFSSYGTWADIAAPGVAIYSTYHSHAAPASDYIAALDGTSMATPLVASVAANVWSKNSGWTAAQVWQRLRDTCDNVYGVNSGTMAGKLGSGRVNLNNALATATAPFCGDGNVDPGETPCNCPQDCGAPPSSETNCSDGVDNDCDGLTDCADSDCASAPNCAPVATQAVVECLTYTTAGGGGGTKNLVLAVQVKNNLGAPLAGASVTVVISRTGASYTRTATTNSAGVATVQVNNATNACYTSNVTAVVISGFTFDGTEPPNGFRKGVDATPDADCRSSNDPCG
jgi:subtilisin family serine protease